MESKRKVPTERLALGIYLLSLVVIRKGVFTYFVRKVPLLRKWDGIQEGRPCHLYPCPDLNDVSLMNTVMNATDFAEAVISKLMNCGSMFSVVKLKHNHLQTLSWENLINAMRFMTTEGCLRLRMKFWVLLPQETQMWFPHLQSIHENRKKGAKAVRTRKAKSNSITWQRTR